MGSWGPTLSVGSGVTPANACNEGSGIVYKAFFVYFIIKCTSSFMLSVKRVSSTLSAFTWRISCYLSVISPKMNDNFFSFLPLIIGNIPKLSLSIFPRFKAVDVLNFYYILFRVNIIQYNICIIKSYSVDLHQLLKLGCLT